MNLWSELPTDLLHQKITNLLTLPDLIKFSCVCTSWQSLPLPTQHRGHLPWLLLPLQNNSPDSGNTWSNSLHFYFILDNKFHELYLPEIKDHRICGSSNGWLIIIHDNADIYLFHPFSKKLIELPSLLMAPGVKGIQYVNEIRYVISFVQYVNGRKRSKIRCWDSNEARDEYIIKLIACSCLNEYVVLGILGQFGRLFLCWPQTYVYKWKMIDDDKDGMYMDVCFYKGEFYAVDTLGGVVVVNCDELSTRKIIDGYGNHSCKFYLVESLGELLKVVRFYGPCGKESDDLEVEDGEESDDLETEDGEESDDLEAEDGEVRLMKTIGFEVWKVDFERGLWVEVKSLGDRALFLGINESSSISSSEFPGCKGNCIYFTDDCERIRTGGYDRGICNLENGMIEAIYPDNDSKMTLPWPIWYSSFHRQS